MDIDTEEAKYTRKERTQCCVQAMHRS